MCRDSGCAKSLKMSPASWSVSFYVISNFPFVFLIAHSGLQLSICISSYSQIGSTCGSGNGGICVSNAYECYELEPPRRNCQHSCHYSHCCWYESYSVIISMKYSVNSLIFLNWRQEMGIFERSYSYIIILEVQNIFIKT